MTRILTALCALPLAACAIQAAPPVSYTCTGSYTTITAEYPDKTTANLTLKSDDGTTSHTLHTTRAASGVRYSSGTDPTKPGDIIWWTKGAEATLYITSPSDSSPGTLEEKQMAICTTP